MENDIYWEQLCAERACLDHISGTGVYAEFLVMQSRCLARLAERDQRQFQSHPWEDPVGVFDAIPAIFCEVQTQRSRNTEP